MNTKYIENQYLEDYYKSFYKTRNLIAAFVIILDIVQDISLLHAVVKEQLRQLERNGLLSSIFIRCPQLY